MAASSRTSAEKPIASAPSAFSAATVSSTLSCDRLATATRAPWRANSSAMPRLMPLVPPTTTTVLPLKSMVMLMTLALPHACLWRHVRPGTRLGHGKARRPTPRYPRAGQDSKLTPPCGRCTIADRRVATGVARGAEHGRDRTDFPLGRLGGRAGCRRTARRRRTADVAIVGGGFTGLSTALHGADAGLDCLVLEASASAMAGRAGTWAS
jgi:hypothetical protein